MDLSRLLPLYPTGIAGLADATDQRVSDYYVDLFRKKEFNDLVLPRVEQMHHGGSFEYLKHQKAVHRLISEHTPVESLLVVHEMGTGKSGTLIGAVEQSLNDPNTAYNRALVIVKSEKLEKNMRSELVKVAPHKYLPENYDRIAREETKSLRINRLISPNYQIETMDRFFTNVIATTSDETLRVEYSNRIIILDEAHFIREKSGGSAKYKAYWRFLHTVTGCKILLLTGTPIQDRAYEIADLMNLILPTDRQMPTGNDFESVFLEEQKDGTVIVKNRERLHDLMKGHISALRQMMASARKEFQTSDVFDPGFKHFKVYASEMSDHQTASYIEAYAKESGGRREGVYINSQEAASFVFPDGTYGSASNKTYYNDKGKVNSSLIDNLRGSTQEETLQNIQKYSAKYASACRSILSKPKEKAFVYTELVTASGALVFAACLRALGYVPFGADKSPALRYTIVTGQHGISGRRVQTIIDSWNSDQNVQGEIIHVFIGSETVAHGFSLLETTQCHVLTPFWNYPKIDQAIARIFRVGSFRRLMKIRDNITVQIYLHVAIPKSDTTPSIDVHMYQISEDKDIKARALTRVIFEVAADCAINSARNMMQESMVDNSRDCDYEECVFRCYGMPHDPPYNVEQYGGVVTDTYELYYAHTEISRIRTEVEHIFKSEFTIPWEHLHRRLAPHSTVLILRCLREMIWRNEPVLNRMGIQCYIRESLGTFYLTDSLVNDGSPLLSWYVKHPFVQENKSYDERVVEEQERRLTPTIDDMCNYPVESSEFQTTFNRLPDYVILEFIQQSMNSDPTTHSDIAKWILQRFKPLITKINELSVLNYKDNYYVLRDGATKWTKASETIQAKVKEAENKYKDRILVNDYGMAGVVSKDGKFKIRLLHSRQNRDARRVHTGQNCESITNEKRIRYLLRLGFTLPLYQRPSTSRETAISQLTSGRMKTKLSDVVWSQYTTESIVSVNMVINIADFDGKKQTAICNIILSRMKELDIVIYE